MAFAPCPPPPALSAQDASPSPPPGLLDWLHTRAVRQPSSEERLEVNRWWDLHYPHAVARLSAQHWTPVDVALRAAQWLVRDASTRVLDVGAGPGKVCLLGALSTPGHFTGVEQRDALVRAARQLTQQFGVTRATYVQGPMQSVDWGPFDAFYFYNSFGENLLPQDLHVDHAVELSEARFARDLRYAQEALARQPPGTRVVTYNGLGGPLPSGYVRRAQEWRGLSPLELWERTHP